VRVLRRAQVTLAAGEGLPVVGGLCAGAAEALAARVAAATAPPFADYDHLSAKEISRRLHELDRAGLLRLQAHERAGKARKTILDAVEKALATP
jgi:hypothetical protein